MNKLFTKIAALTLGVAMAAGVGVAVGAAKASPVKAADGDIEITFPGEPSTKTSAYTKTFTMTVGGITFTFANWNNGSSSDSWDAIRGGQKSSAWTGTITSGLIENTVEKVEVTITQVASSTGSKLEVASDANFTENVQTVDHGAITTTGKTTFTVPTQVENSYYRLTFNQSANANGSIRVGGIKYVAGASVSDPAISLNPSELSFLSNEGSKAVTVVPNDQFTGTPTISISGTPSFVNCSVSGLVITVSPKAVGSETITVNAVYNTQQASATLSVEVLDSHGRVSDDPFTVAEIKALIDQDKSAVHNNVYVSGIISQIDSYSSKYSSITYWISDDGKTTSQFQCYGGKGIDSANFASENDIVVGAEVVVCGNAKFFGSSSVYEFDANNYLVSYNVPAPVEPAIALSNSYKFLLSDDDPFVVTVEPNSVFEGVPTIAINGDPECVDVAINGLELTITPVKKGVEAIQIVATYNTQVAGAVFYAIVDPISVAEAHALLDLVPTATFNGVYVQGIVSKIEEFKEAKHAITYWISDDGTQTNEFEVYEGKGIGGADFSAEEDVQVGAHVVVKGSIKTYNTTHEFASGNELVSYVVPTVKTLVSVTLNVDNAKDSYHVGEEFDKTGIVATAHYSDESTADVSDLVEYSGFDSSEAVAQQVITATYTESEVSVSDTFIIEITSEPVPVKEDWTKEEKDLFAERFEGFRDVPFCPEINDFAWNKQISAYVLTPEEDISEAVATVFADWEYYQGSYYSDNTGHGYVVLQNYSGAYYLFWQQAAWFDEQIADFQEKLDGYVPTFNPALVDFKWNANLGCYTLGGFYDESGYYQYYVGQELVSEDEFSAVEGAENVYYRYTTNGTVYLACIIQQSGESTVFGAQLWYVKDPIPTSLQLDTSAVKLDYYVGQKFDATGLVVNVLDENGEVMYGGQNFAEHCEFVYDFSEVGEATVTVNLDLFGLSTTINVTVAENPYDAEVWAEEFLTAVQNVCANYDGKKNNAKALADVWKIFKDNDHYGALSDEEQAILRTTAADQKGSTIAKALAFYDYACKKYGLEKFIGGRTVKAVAFEVETPTTSNRNALIAIAIVSFVAVTGVGLTIVIRRRKATNVK